MMSNSSAQTSPSTSNESNDNNNRRTLHNTLPHPLPPNAQEARRTPTEAIVNFDGDIETVRANSVTFTNRCCNRQALSFWVHVLSLSVALLSSLILMIVLSFTGIASTESPLFTFWAGIFTFAIGAFIPSPNYKAMKSGAPSA